MFCPACSTTNREGRRFCAQCGASLALACSHCGFTNEPEEKFCGGCGKPTAPSQAASASAAPAQPARPPANALAQSAPAAAGVSERRQLTVMFCDLVGSTALSERLDPEELREVVRAYQRTAFEVVERYQGHIAQYLGDGLLVYFGYPQAHEDSAQRAVRAGLGIVDAMRVVQLPVPDLSLAVRIGIHSGAVVVGDVGGGARQEQLALGETPNIAARLQALATPGSLVIGETTLRLIEGLYDCEELGAQQLAGISQAMRAYRIVGESGVQSHFEAKAERGLTLLVGREEEVNVLFKRWQQVTEGEGQTILISGEAGVGKSRVLREFRDRLANEARNRVLYFCSPYHRDTPYYPVIEHVERSLRFTKHDTPALKLGKLEALIRDFGLPLATLVPWLAALLGLPASADYPSAAVSTEDRKKRTLQSLLSLLEAMSQRAPVLMVVEDLQWADAPTMEMLKLITEWQASKRLMLIITHRPEFEPTWSSFSHTVSMKLNRLGRRESTELATRIAGGKALPDEVLEHIIARTDGIPLFVEELTKTVLESNLLKDAGDRYVLSGPLPAHAIPASLQDSLMARLDRLAPVKEVAQIAATLGRRFTQELLAAVSRLAITELDDALSRLIGAELVYRRGLAPEVIYEFKHALVQDAAYNSLLRSKCRQLHLEIARILEEKFPETVAAQPELLSHHYVSAGLPERAIPYLLRAGDVAVSRYASTEATAHYQAALEMAQALQDSDKAARARIECVLKLASVASKREDFERDLKNLEQARELAAKLDARADLCRIFYWMGRTNYVLGRFDRGAECAAEALRLAKELGDDDSLSAEPVNLLARIHCLRGEPREASAHALRNVGQMHRLGNRMEEAAVSGVLAFAYGLHGQYREASAAANHGLGIAKDLQHLPTLAACHMFRAVVDGWFGNLEPAVAEFEHALTTSERANDRFRQYVVYGWRGEAYLIADDFDAAGRELAQCIALGDQIGTSFHRGAFEAFRAKVMLHAADVAGAQGAAEKAVMIAADSGQPWSHSIALQVHAEVLLAAGRLDEAEQAARAAMRIQDERECRRDLAWSCAILGRILTATGDLEGATAALGNAHQAFERLGIARGIEKVSAALLTMGRSPIGLAV